MGTAAWAADDTRQTSRPPSRSSRFTAGTTTGPVAAGVRSTVSLPAPRRAEAWRAWARAQLASKTSRTPGWRSTPSIPSPAVGIPLSRARRMPSASSTTSATSSRRRGGDASSSLEASFAPSLPAPRTATPTEGPLADGDTPAPADTALPSGRPLAEEQDPARHRHPGNVSDVEAALLEGPSPLGLVGEVLTHEGVDQAELGSEPLRPGGAGPG